MIYDIVNPSDAYTIDCPDLEIAAVAVCLLGGGQYGLEPLDPPDAPRVPLFLFGGAEEFFQSTFGAPFEVVLERVKAGRRADLTTALESVYIGTLADRRVYGRMCTKMTDEQAAAFRAAWHEERRSSLNDIGARAWRIAAALRVGEQPTERPPQQVFSTLR